jgi:FtsH-binding integral membrane protein
MQNVFNEIESGIIMHQVSSKIYWILGCVFSFVAFCAGAAVSTSMNYGLDADIGSAAVGAFIGFGLLAFFCIRQALRTKGQSKTFEVSTPIPVTGYRCPCCNSTSKIEQLPADNISPFARYKCGSCGTDLNSPTIKLLYAIISVLAISLLVVAILFMAESRRFFLKFGWLAVVVLVYSLRQLMRRSIRKAIP